MINKIVVWSENREYFICTYERKDNIKFHLDTNLNHETVIIDIYNDDKLVMSQKLKKAWVYDLDSEEYHKSDIQESINSDLREIFIL